MTREEIKAKYTPGEITEIFEYKLLEYTTEDAQFHIEEFCDWKELPKDEAEKLHSLAEKMADDYLHKYSDPSLAENDIWENIVSKYYKDYVKLPKALASPIKMSFYDGTLDREVLRAFIEKTDKPIKYTYGFEYRHPTTYRVPMSKTDAFRTVANESLLDATEYEDFLLLNAYSSNDMW